MSTLPTVCPDCAEERLILPDRSAEAKRCELHEAAREAESDPEPDNVIETDGTCPDCGDPTCEGCASVGACAYCDRLDCNEDCRRCPDCRSLTCDGFCLDPAPCSECGDLLCDGCVWLPCTVCKRTPVCASDGYDTCADCVRAS